MIKNRNKEKVIFSYNAEAFNNYIREKVHLALKQLFEQELSALCGERYGRDNDGEYYRAGSAFSYVMTKAGREPMQRPSGASKQSGRQQQRSYFEQLEAGTESR